jgi:hypothetical protein
VHGASRYTVHATHAPLRASRVRVRLPHTTTRFTSAPPSSASYGVIAHRLSAAHGAAASLTAIDPDMHAPTVAPRARAAISLTPAVEFPGSCRRAPCGPPRMRRSRRSPATDPGCQQCDTTSSALLERAASDNLSRPLLLVLMARVGDTAVTCQRLGTRTPPRHSWLAPGVYLCTVGLYGRMRSPIELLALPSAGPAATSTT